MSLKQLAKRPVFWALMAWYLLAWSWVLFTDSLDLAGSKPQAIAVALLVLAVNATFSTLVIIYGFKLIKMITAKINPVIAIALALPLFALMEFAIAWLTAIVWIGPQGSVDNILPISSPTLLLINTPLRYAARLVGFFGLAAFFWLIIFVVKERRLRRFAWLPVMVLVICSAVGWYVYKNPNGGEFKATIVSEALDSRVSPQPAGNSKLVIFPEYGLDEITNANLDQRVEQNSNKPKTFFLGSQQVRNGAPTGHLNELLYGNSQDGITHKQDKIRLIPGGEDLSYIVRVLLRATNQRGTLDYFSYAKMVIKGPHQLTPFSIDDSTKLGAAVCSSIIAPKDYQLFAGEGATVFSNSASLTIFRGSRVFAFEQKSLARFMATANSRYFLQSANAASAYALDNNGKQIAEVRGVQSTDVMAKNNTTKTFYTYTGEYLVAVGMLIVGVYLVLYIRKNQADTKTKKPGKKASKKNKA